MSEQSSFELFLDEASRLARASHEVLARPRTPESLHEAIGALVAIELDARTVGVTDLADLTGALRLYERAGFRTTETKTGVIWGAERTEVRMDLKLGA